MKTVKNSLNLLPNSNKFHKYWNVLIEYGYTQTNETHNCVSIHTSTHGIKRRVFCSFKANEIPKLFIKRVENIFEKWEIKKKCIRHGTRGHLFIMFSPRLLKLYFTVSFYSVFALIPFYTYLSLTITSSNLLLQSFSIPHFVQLLFVLIYCI